MALDGRRQRPRRHCGLGGAAAAAAPAGRGLAAGAVPLRARFARLGEDDRHHAGEPPLAVPRRTSPHIAALVAAPRRASPRLAAPRRASPPRSSHPLPCRCCRTTVWRAWCSSRASPSSSTQSSPSACSRVRATPRSSAAQLVEYAVHPFVSEDRALSASLGRLKLRPRLRIPGAPPEQPSQVVSASRLSGRPKVEDVGPPSTARHHPVWAHAQVPHQSARSQASTPARSRPSPARPHAFAAPCVPGQWPT